MTYPHRPIPLIFHFEASSFQAGIGTGFLLFRLAVHTLLFCASVMLSLAALGLAVYKGGQVGYDMGGNFVHFMFLAFVL